MAGVNCENFGAAAEKETEKSCNNDNLSEHQSLVSNVGGEGDKSPLPQRYEHGARMEKKSCSLRFSYQSTYFVLTAGTATTAATAATAATSQVMLKTSHNSSLLRAALILHQKVSEKSQCYKLDDGTETASCSSLTCSSTRLLNLIVPCIIN